MRPSCRVGRRCLAGVLKCGPSSSVSWQHTRESSSNSMAQEQQQHAHPITRGRLEAIRRTHLHIANDPDVPLVGHRRYVEDVGDLLAECMRLGEVISLMAEMEVKMSAESDAQILELVHANDRLRAERATRDPREEAQS